MVGCGQKAQHAGRTVRERSGVSDFRLHTPRTTARTRFSKIGVGADTGERILGHAMGRVRQIYDRHDYVAENEDRARGVDP